MFCANNRNWDSLVLHRLQNSAVTIVQEADEIGRTCPQNITEPNELVVYKH